MKLDVVKISGHNSEMATRKPKSAVPRSRTKQRPAPPSAYHHGDLRNALIDAAQTLLAERGVEGFTLRECARRARVSHGAPAHHFGDVTGLLSAVAARGFECLGKAMARYADEAGNDASARLTASGLAYIDCALEHPATFQLMFRCALTDPSRESLGKAGSAAYQALEAGLRAAQSRLRDASKEDFLPDLLLHWSAVHGLATLILEGQLDAHLGGRTRAQFGQEIGRRMLQAMAKSLGKSAKVVAAAGC